jgi:lambda family phage minor tail protein L
MTLSALANIEKNKLSSTGAWIVLFTIQTPGGDIIRLCLNNEDVYWPSTPTTVDNLYIAFPLELDEIGETSKGEVPQIAVKVSNVSRAIQYYLEKEQGMMNSEVIIRVVHSGNITTASLGAGEYNADPEVTLNYDIIDSHSDSKWVTFILGSGSPYRMRFPKNRVMRNFCPFLFKGARCKYSGEETSCDRSLYTCRNIMNNSENFGGAPGIGRRGVYV